MADDILRPKVLKTIKRDEHGRISEIEQQHLDVVADVAKALAPMIREETRKVAEAVADAAEAKADAAELARVKALHDAMDAAEAAETKKAACNARMRAQVRADEAAARAAGRDPDSWDGDAGEEDPESPTSTVNELSVTRAPSRIVLPKEKPKSPFEHGMAGAELAGVDNPEAEANWKRMKAEWHLLSPARKSAMYALKDQMLAAAAKEGEQIVKQMHGHEMIAKAKAEVRKRALDTLETVRKRAEQYERDQYAGVRRVPRRR